MTVDRYTNKDALGAVRELVAKWRHQEPTCSALASQNRKDAFRRCANELEAALASQAVGVKADFDTWQQNPYTKVLMKSIDEDYMPKHGQQPAAVDGAMATQGKKHDGPCWRNSHADCGC